MISTKMTASIAAAIAEAGSHSIDPLCVIEGESTAPTVLWCNRAFANSLKRVDREIIGSPLYDFFVQDETRFSLNNVRRLVGTVEIKENDGSRSMWVAAALPTNTDDWDGWVIRTVREDSGLLWEHRLRESEDRFRALSEQAPIGIFSSEAGLRFEFVNDAFAHLLGVPASRLLGTDWIPFVDERDLETVTHGLENVLQGTRFDSLVRLRTSKGSEVWANLQVVPIGTGESPAGFLGTVEDVTERRTLESFLSWQANHDPLTQLKNRSQLTCEVQDALDTSPENMALLFCDIDDFKGVNDNYGHSVGDELLISIAQRLEHSVRSSDAAFRFAGDEFVVLARNVSDEAEALGLAERIRAAVSQPASIRGRTFGVGCSIGVALGDQSKKAEELIHDADTAMYHAKAAGKGGIHLITRAELGRRDADAQLLKNVICAIESNALWLEYQPFVETSTGVTQAVQATLCWDDERFGPIDSAQIFQAAIYSGRTEEVTRFVIDQTCADLAAWRESGAAPKWVSIGLTPEQLHAPGIVDHLARTLLASKLAGSDLAIELAEAAWATSDAGLQRSVADLTSIGCRLVLDKVGAELSSLKALAVPNLGAIKLDPTFAFDKEDLSKPVVAAIIRLARTLDLEVIATGIETEVEKLEAEALHIGLGQGSSLGRSVIAAAVPSLFEEA